LARHISESAGLVAGISADEGSYWRCSKDIDGGDVEERQINRWLANPLSGFVLSHEVRRSEARRALWAFVASLAVAAGVAAAARALWAPPASFYVYNIPIAVCFALFVIERLLTAERRAIPSLLVDLIVVSLALLRVLAPPLPFVSGHALFLGYAALTASSRPLRASALVVLAEVTYIKLFVSGGWVSLVAGLVVAGLAAIIRPSRAPAET
jgi:hypothetical protein